MAASTIKSTKTKHYNGLLTKNSKAVTYFIMMKHLKKYRDAFDTMKVFGLF
jgi:hypothetical protein